MDGWSPDLRRALLHSQVTLPQRTEALSCFAHPLVRTWPAHGLRAGLIGVAQVIAPAIESVIANHVDQQEPLLREGDSSVPSRFARTPVQVRADPGRVRAVFVVEPEEAASSANVLAGGRGVSDWTAEEVRRDARAKWLYGPWLAQEAQRYGLPVVAPRPWETLVERLPTASTAADV